jgi:hypothetical protein
MLKLWLAIVVLLLSVSAACATPTPTVNTLTWNAYTDTNGVGFYMYWRQNSAGSVYSNTNRVQITGTTTVQDAISAVVPIAHPSSLCFVMTAYDGVGSESSYSNEICGFVGFTAPAGLAGK